MSDAPLVEQWRKDLEGLTRQFLARFAHKHPITGALIGLFLACVYVFLCLFTTKSSN